MAIHNKLDRAIGSLFDNPSGKKLAVLFAAAALGTAASLWVHADKEHMIKYTSSTEILSTAKGKALVATCVKEQEESVRNIIAPAPFTPTPAFTSAARHDCLHDHDVKELAIQEKLAYREFELLEDIGLAVGVIAGTGFFAGFCTRLGRALKPS